MQPANPPNIAQRAWNLAAALAEYVADGCQSASSDDYASRLKICNACPYRSENICLVCGCYLTLKAQGRAMQCPLGNWPADVGATAALSGEAQPSTTVSADSTSIFSFQDQFP